jgi:hypothetical protein
MLAKGLIEQTGCGRFLSGRELHFDAAVAQAPRSSPGSLLRRIVGGDDDPADPGLENRLRAGRLATVVRTRLQRHVHGRPGRILSAFAAILQRRPLRMQLTEFGVPSLPNDLAVTHDDRTDEGIRTDPTSPALSKLQRPLQVLPIRGCQLSVHGLIDWSVNGILRLSRGYPGKIRAGRRDTLTAK